MNLDKLTLRELQLEAARALNENTNIAKFNALAHHDSQKWYKAVITWYVEQYGSLPSECEPGKSVRLLHVRL